MVFLVQCGKHAAFHNTKLYVVQFLSSVRVCKSNPLLPGNRTPFVKTGTMTYCCHSTLEKQTKRKNYLDSVRTMIINLLNNYTIKDTRSNITITIS